MSWLGGGSMTRLVDAVRELGLDAAISPGGRFVRLDGERGAVYVAEASHGGGFITWCDLPSERVVERYPDATTAIQAGLRRATRSAPDNGKASTDA